MKNVMGKVAICACVPLLVLLGFAFTNGGIPIVTPLISATLMAVGYLVKKIVLTILYGLFISLPICVGFLIFKTKREMFGKSPHDWLCGTITAIFTIPFVFKTYSDTLDMTILITLSVIIICLFYLKPSLEDFKGKYSAIPNLFVLGCILISITIIFIPRSNSMTEYSQKSNITIISLAKKGDEGAEKEFQFRVNEIMKSEYFYKMFTFISAATPPMDEDPRKGYLRITRPHHRKPIIICYPGKDAVRAITITNELERRFCEKNAGSY